MTSMTLSIATTLVLTGLLMLLIPSHTIGQDKISKNALAQTSDGAANTFEIWTNKLSSTWNATKDQDC
jgi:hypothetical protein